MLRQIRISRKSLLVQYTLSYLTVALLACAVFGLALFDFSVRELNRTVRGKNEYQLQLIAEDFDRQLSAMRNVGLKIRTMFVYKPFYWSANPYYELEMVQNFAQFSNYTSLSSTYFMFLRGNDWGIRPNAKNDFDVYAQRVLNLTQSVAVYEQLNAISQLTVIVPQSQKTHYALIALPTGVPSSSAPSGDAVLFYAVSDEQFQQRIRSVVGEMPGVCALYYQGVQVYSSDPLPEKGQYEILCAELPEKGIRVEIYADSDMLYGPLNGYRVLMGEIFLGTFLFSVLVALTAAYRSYYPVRELKKRYLRDAHLPDDIQNEWMIMDDVLANMRTRDQDLQAKLRDQYARLRRQTLLLLFSGKCKEDPEQCGIALRGGWFGALYIQMEDVTKNIDQSVEDLSDDSLQFFCVSMGTLGVYYVLVCAAERSMREEALELVREAISTQDGRGCVRAGCFYDRLECIPESVREACAEQTACEAQEDAVSQHFSVEKLIDYVNTNCLNSNFSLTQVADVFGISSGQVSRLIREKCGKPYLEYVTDYRIDQAKRLLTDRRGTIAETAAAVGYVKTSYFIKRFKDRTGLTPAAYRDVALDREKNPN